MDDYQFNDFEELLKALGYHNCNEKSKDDKEKSYEDFEDYSGFDSENICEDMTGGFQQMYPQLFVVIGEVIGNIVARKMPVNVQDAIGNWLQLIGQVILTYNAQQQYFQGGPGRYFNEKYFNVNNPLCNTDNPTYDERGRVVKRDTEGNIIRKTGIRPSNEKQLKKEIRELKKSIEKLQYEVDKLKGC